MHTERKAAKKLTPESIDVMTDNVGHRTWLLDIAVEGSDVLDDILACEEQDMELGLPPWSTFGEKAEERRNA